MMRLTVGRLLLLFVVCVGGHLHHNVLWECQCWDKHLNDILKKAPTPRPTRQPTYSPLPADWPAIFNPELFNRG